MKWLIGQYQGRRLGPSWVRGMQTLNVLHPWSSTSPVSAKLGSSLLLTSMSPTPLSPHEDPQPSPCTPQWVVWCARHVQMPPCWEELTTIPGHEDYKEFAQKVHTSFEVPKACNCVKGGGQLPHTTTNSPLHWKAPYSAA